MRFFKTIEAQLINRTSQVPRYWSNRELRHCAGMVQGDVSNVSGWKDEDKQGGHYRDYFPGATSYTVTNYGGTSGFQGGAGEIFMDLSAPLPRELHGAFDAVLCHTVLEHVFDVNTAFRNLAEMTRDLLLVVVPFCQAQHELPSFGDYWRFTPSSLRELCHCNGLTVLYESSNVDAGCGNYLLFVASRKPERYPQWVRIYSPLGLQGKWIGNTWWQRIVPHLWIRKIAETTVKENDRS